MLKLIIFDLDGTIGDTIPLCITAFKKAAAPYVQRDLSEEEIIQTFGLNEEGMIKQVTGEDWEKALKDFYIYYQQMHDMCPHPFEGIKALIEKLKAASLLVALVTGKGERSCTITLKQFGMENCFDHIETGSPVKNRKAEAIGHLLQIHSLQPQEALYIGDTVSDVFACQKAGIECLSAAWAEGILIADLEKTNAQNVFRSIAALSDRIDRNLKTFKRDINHTHPC